MCVVTVGLFSGLTVPFHFRVYKVFVIIWHFTTGAVPLINVLIIMQSFMMGLQTAVAVHLYSPHYYNL